MDKEYIKSVIQKVINKEFSPGVERNIILHDNRIQFRCPYCHEGRTKSKKRGNIYLDKLMYVCFRCDKKTTFDKFAKDFNEQIDPDKKLEMIEHLNNVVTYSDYESDFIDTKIDNLIELSELEKVFQMDLSNITEFTPVIKNGGVYKYLINRGIVEKLHTNIYQAKYWKNEDEYEWVIVMLNRNGNKVLGMQIRNLKQGKRRMFKIYNYENLLELVNIGKENVDININKLVVYNKLSYYFNILNVDFSKKITIFEGYLDSLFFPNSIGLVGVNTDSKFIENNDLDIQYFFDNDEVGYKKSEEKIKQGYPVFLWKKLFEDIVNKKNNEDPIKLLYRISKIKDMNKLSELINNPYKKLNLDTFFSKDNLDLKWIPLYKKYKKEEKDYNLKFKNFDKI